MSMLVAIHAPSGRATITLSGGALFQSGGASPPRIPRCTIHSWTNTVISISDSGDDGDNPGGHFASRIDVELPPLSGFNVNLDCTSGASMWFQLDPHGRKTCKPGQNVDYSFFGLVGDQSFEGPVAGRDPRVLDLFPLHTPDDCEPSTDTVGESGNDVTTEINTSTVNGQQYSFTVKTATRHGAIFAVNVDTEKRLHALACAAVAANRQLDFHFTDYKPGQFLVSAMTIK